MGFKVNSSKIANLYFFISNLAEWHPNCRKEYNTEWLKLTGPLSNQERRLLGKASEIFSKYTNRNLKFRSPYLDIIFYTPETEKQVWRKINRLLSKKDREILKESFVHFTTRFETIWIKSKVSAEIMKSNLQRLLLQNHIQFIVQVVEKIFGAKLPRQAFRIILIVSPIKHMYFGKWPGKTLILLEQNEIRTNKQKKQALVVLFHEIIHYLIEHGEVKKLITKFVGQINDIESSKIEKYGLRIQRFFEEAVTHSFTPEGYLAEKYLNIQVRKRIERVLKYKSIKFNRKNLPLFFHWLAASIYKMTKQYIDNKKVIDQKYLQEIYFYTKIIK